MLGKSHTLIGASAGAFMAHLVGAPLLEGASVGGFAGAANDVDTPGSMFGRYLPGWWHKLTKGHRGPTHAPLGVLAFAALIWWVGFPLVALFVATGMSAHILADGVTEAGCPWLWPLSRKRMALPHLLAIKTGGVMEVVVVVGVLVGTAWWLWGNPVVALVRATVE
jgi:membrane-bound metal-dependent hydrolase YbcI (DUF457 family)